MGLPRPRSARRSSSSAASTRTSSARSRRTRPSRSGCSTSASRRYKTFLAKPDAAAGAANLNDIDFDKIYYYLKPEGINARTWDDVPEDIKNTFERLGIPEAERKFLAGVGAQYESEVVYHNLAEGARG